MTNAVYIDRTANSHRTAQVNGQTRLACTPNKEGLPAGAIAFTEGQQSEMTVGKGKRAVTFIHKGYVVCNRCNNSQGHLGR